MNLFGKPTFIYTTTMTKLNDEQLYQLTLDGNERAFDQLYNRHSSSLLGFINKFMGNRQMSEEILQDTFIKVFKGSPLDFSEGSFRGWLFMVARNRCIDVLRKAPPQSMSWDESHFSLLDPGSSQELQKVVNTLRKIAFNLPSPFNHLYKLKASGLSNKEISKIQKVPIGTVKSRLHKMMTLIKKEMNS